MWVANHTPVTLSTTRSSLGLFESMGIWLGAPIEESERTEVERRGDGIDNDDNDGYV